MTEDPLLPQLLILFVLILVNAFFAAAEIALISLSEAKLKKQIEDGDRRAKKLLKLVQAPDRLLSTIQICITLAGFLSSAYAADAFSDRLVLWLMEDVGFTAISATSLNGIMVVFITIVLSYFSLVLGELVPKRIAMKKSAAVARLTGNVVYAMSVFFRPLIWFLSISTNSVLRLFRIDPSADEEDVSEDEILMMVDLGEERGTIESTEKELIENIFEFNNTTAKDVMVHRTDMTMIWAEDGLSVVTGLEMGEIEEPDPNRPSLVLCRAGEESLWSLAKRTGSTVEAIKKANNLETEPEGKQLLLIPVS